MIKNQSIIQQILALTQIIKSLEIAHYNECMHLKQITKGIFTRFNQ